jgi:hypothetical protein
VLLREITKTIVPRIPELLHAMWKGRKRHIPCKSQSNEDDLKANGNSRAFQEFFVATSCNNPANKQTEKSC